MSTTVYLIRHAEPNYENHDDYSRELTAKGLEDSVKATDFLLDKSVNLLYSIPFKRATDTVKHFSEHYQLPILLEEDFRERKIDNIWIEDFDQFAEKQWRDFSYKLSDGESLGQVQKRTITALETLLEKHAGKTIAVSSHGTALSTIVNYYQPSFTLKQFQEIKGIFPFVIQLTFEDKVCTNAIFYNILKEPIYETHLF